MQRRTWSETKVEMAESVQQVHLGPAHERERREDSRIVRRACEKCDNAEDQTTLTTALLLPLLPTLAFDDLLDHGGSLFCRRTARLSG